MKKVREQVTDANAVGDLAALTARLDALGPVLAQQREVRRGERAKKLEESRERKEQIVVEAEKLARGPRLAQRCQPAARPARGVEGAPPAGPRDRRRVVAPLLVRAHVVHAGAQGALRRAGREARRCAAGQGAADQGGGGARDVHRVGPDRRQVPRADAAVEGGRPRREGRGRRRCGGASVAPRTSSSEPARQRTPSRTRSSPPTR